jgi:hypothetical protein
MTTNYKVGKIYKIIHNQSDIVYIGSTFNRLSDRFNQHKSNYNSWLNKKHNKISIFKYFKEFGIENFKIILIKEYLVADRKQLQAYEALWINKLKSCNNNNSFHWLSGNNHNKLYYENNKTILAEKQKIYYRFNIDKFKEYEKTKRVRPKEFYEKVECLCGGKYQNRCRWQHERSKKHIEYINSL